MTAGGGGGRRWWRRRRRRLFRHEAAAAGGTAAAAAAAASLAREAAPGRGRAGVPGRRRGSWLCGSAAQGGRLRGPCPPRPALGARRLPGRWASPPRWVGPGGREQAPLDAPRRRGRPRRRGLLRLAPAPGPRCSPSQPARSLPRGRRPLTQGRRRSARHEGPAAGGGRAARARAAGGVRGLGWTCLRGRGGRSRRVRGVGGAGGRGGAAASPARGCQVRPDCCGRPRGGTAEARLRR